MSRNLIPDYQPQDGSYQVGGGDWRYGQDMVGLALDSMLTGLGSVDGVSDSNSALAPFEQMLYNMPLSVLKMFRGFTFGTTDADWDDQYSAVQAIMGTFRPKARLQDWVADFELKTGLNIDEGAAAFLKSLVELLAPVFAKVGAWVTEFETKTGLHLSEGPLKFIQSLLAKMKEFKLDWITDLETKTGLNFDEGVLKFIQSLVAKLKELKLDWITDLEAKTALELDSGPDQFLASLVLKLQPKWIKDWVTDFETKTGLDISHGALKFIQSLLAKIKEFNLDWITEFEAKTGLEIDSGAAAFLQSLVDKLKPKWLKDWVDDFELKTGLNIDAGALAFFQSLLAKLKELKLDWVTDFEAKTGLNIDEGPVKFLASLMGLLKLERLQELINGIADFLTPGTGDRPIADAIAAILGIKTSAETAQAAADRANIGLAAIKAEQAGGGSDEFNYPPGSLPAASYEAKTSGTAAGSYGPDGEGVLAWTGPTIYVGPGYRYFLRKDKPAANASEGSAATVLTKGPKQNALAPAHAYLIVKASVSDLACVRASIAEGSLMIEIVNAAGTVSAGTAVSIKSVDGDSYELKFNATEAWLLRNNIEVARRNISSAVTDANHRLAGVGAHIPNYSVLAFKNNPCPHFAGLAWH